MPIYDYKCKECGYVFETAQKMTEKPLEFCPKCSGPVKRLISASGIIFKGSGFHITDYKKEAKTEKKTPKPVEKPKEPKNSSEAASPKKSE
ncbi:hypothetical protein A2276_06265 [candidate division WOR-1 bacterium RIFOXYA12_FULL_43_27]|uniref:Putative regulatory protein FmdB zinc ribbon domain-containing protein n=1 Tax=candidate division WOR-1 bacterium RIFOXYC2_FULL_46_14 TaxID=1802587 RepID=A0A1F4U576_UNCSA|nr:MAG: hypothetical protein A2276_06265 [candidate division WOR-1 bacterium RIFOXYA12_FULL_43_27]OGC20257.1 MAG: hypothetical protein A2292_04265 [candidate division WOR-1 bacterium RIFOXYB2_FULL_46_45]OGC32006.1 MAG: hypothetical protein A2232_07185 [candidate division WOR-1 bacterium RIFOXYA2_FULL_46_56]OGC40104.1 MAG: hypothetical protein A2438_02285 [candidate division WOR-1 bacterium RIFOXYC2_FULL_46_14]